MSIQITSFKGIKLLNAGKLRAFVDVEFNGALVVKGFKVIEGSKGMFVANPARKVEGSTDANAYTDIVYVTKESGEWNNIQPKIIAYYNEQVAAAPAGAPAASDI